MRKIIAASAAIIKDKKILLCKRSQSERKFPGYWALPGGKLDDGESFSDAVKREMKEELGVDFLPKEELGFYSYKGEDYEAKGHIFVGDIKGKIKLNDEIEEFRWFRYADVEFDMAFAHRKVIDDLHRRGLI
jgi:8-oxo-dGTP diphosphatase